jgi:hypothetical protein
MRTRKTVTAKPHLADGIAAAAAIVCLGTALAVQETVQPRMALRHCCVGDWARGRRRQAGSCGTWRRQRHTLVLVTSQAGACDAALRGGTIGGVPHCCPARRSVHRARHKWRKGGDIVSNRLDRWLVWF